MLDRHTKLLFKYRRLHFVTRVTQTSLYCNENEGVPNDQATTDNPPKMVLRYLRGLDLKVPKDRSVVLTRLCNDVDLSISRLITLAEEIYPNAKDEAEMRASLSHYFDTVSAHNVKIYRSDIEYSKKCREYLQWIIRKWRELETAE